MAAGLYAQVGSKVTNAVRDIKKDLRVGANDAVAESEAEWLRRIATQQMSLIEAPHLDEETKQAPEINTIDPIDLEHYKILGLDPKKPLTEEGLHQAFNKAIKGTHPDLHKGYSPDGARKVIEAFRALLEKAS